MKKSKTKKFFANFVNWILKDNIHPVFCQYNVICSAFCSYGLEICRSSGGKFILFWRWGKGGREKLFCRLGFWCWCSGLQMCFFLCGGFFSLVFEWWWKNIVYKRKNISFKRSNMIYRCKNMIYNHENIIYKGKNITFGCANIVLWWKNIKTSQRNIRLGCENIKNGRCNWESSCFNIKWEKWIWLRRRLCIRERLLRRGFWHIFLRFGRWNINLFRLRIRFGLFL